MYCNKCGYEVTEGAKFCPNCGNNLDGTVTTVNNNESDGNILSILAIVFAVVMPIVGLIISLVCKNQYSDPETKNKFKIATIISSVLLVISAVVVIFTLLFAFSNRFYLVA